MRHTNAVILTLWFAMLFAVPAASQDVRITSYNVCYTKLLRQVLLLHREEVHAGLVDVGQAGVGVRLENGRGQQVGDLPEALLGAGEPPVRPALGQRRHLLPDPSLGQGHRVV